MVMTWSMYPTAAAAREVYNHPRLDGSNEQERALLHPCRVPSDPSKGGRDRRSAAHHPQTLLRRDRDALCNTRRERERVCKSQPGQSVGNDRVFALELDCLQKLVEGSQTAVSCNT